MWKPASQLQCCSWFTWAQRGLRLKAGSFATLHSGGAAIERDERMHQKTHKRSQKGGVSPTCLGLVLAVRSAPPLGADAPVLIKPFHTGTSVLAGVAGALACDCGQRAERSLQPAVGTAMLKAALNDSDVRSLCLLVVRADQKQIWLLGLRCRCSNGGAACCLGAPELRPQYADRQPVLFMFTSLPRGAHQRPI